MKPCRVVFPLLVVCAAGWLGAVTPALGADDLGRGAKIYQNNCAACHGSTGTPVPAMAQSLGVMPATFSDPLFNSREALSRWKVVVAEGGPALGFSDKMPAFGGKLSAEEIEAVLAHIKTLGGRHDYPDGKLNMLLPIRTKKAFPEDEWVWKQRYTKQDGDNAWKNTLEYEFRIGQRGQGIIEVNHQKVGDESKFGHFEPGFKYVLKHDEAAGFIMAAAAQVGVPLNSDENWEFLPYVSFGKILSDSLTLQGSGRLTLDLEDSDNNGAEFAAVIHWVDAPRPRWVFPALEIVAEVPFERGSGIDRQDAVQWSIIPQARIGLNKRGNIALNAAVEFPLNERDRYDWRAYAYFIWDFADGGLLDGW